MSAMYASLFPDEHLKNLVLLAAPTDFAPDDPGIFGLWTLWTRNSENYFDIDANRYTYRDSQYTIHLYTVDEVAKPGGASGDS